MTRSRGADGGPSGPPAVPREQEVQRITSARVPLSEDVDRRMRRYLVQMSVRVACFLGAVVVDHWTRWLLLVGAVLLPYLAVVLANAGREEADDPGTFLEPPSLPASPSVTGLGTVPRTGDLG
ncbi:DUF3099 domain-containing protein [Actinotalea sp.]|uniref:DUF3099 domain-containing protein n=1 Tax=Actinotalea sp. TaxID=1872145 RepID=UPI0035661038